MNIKICPVCKAEFREEALAENGKCATCNKLWPDANVSDERNNPKTDEKENEGRMKNVIRKEVDAILLEYGILATCVCGNLYHRASPAQKQCKLCAGK